MTDKYAVIGNPIAHSKSPLIHALFRDQFTGQARQNISYGLEPAPLEPGGFAKTVQRLIDEGYKGCNVTVPFKFQAFFELKSERSERAILARAANTLKFVGDKIFSDNTDGAGLVCDLKKNLNFDFSNKRILLVGAGGAGWGVLPPLLQEYSKCTVISNRNMIKAEEAAKILHSAFRNHIKTADFVAKSFADLEGGCFDLVINATSSGLKNEMLDLPPRIFAPGALAYDMMYGKQTPFMRFAREQGAERVSDGLGMLVEQAAESFFIWRGVLPETASVLAHLRSEKVAG